MRNMIRNRLLALMLGFCLLLTGCVGLSLQEEIAGLMKQGESLYAEKKYDAALGKFADVILKDPQYWRAYVWSARTLVAQGSWIDAIKHAKKAFDMAPKGEEVVPVLAEALLGGGRDALNRGKPKDAIALFKEYIQHDAGNVSAYAQLAKAYFQSGEFGNATEAFRKILKIDPSNEEALQFIQRF